MGGAGENAHVMLNSSQACVRLRDFPRAYRVWGEPPDNTHDSAHDLCIYPVAQPQKPGKACHGGAKN